MCVHVPWEELPLPATQHTSCEIGAVLHSVLYCPTMMNHHVAAKADELHFFHICLTEMMYIVGVSCCKNLFQPMPASSSVGMSGSTTDVKLEL